MALNLHHLSIALLTPAVVGLIMMLACLFTSYWIQVTYPWTISVQNNTDLAVVTNSSWTCREGVFVKCCYVNRVYSYPDHKQRPWRSRTEGNACYLRGSFKNIYDDVFGDNKTAEAFAALSITCTVLGILVSLVFAYAKKFQELNHLRLVQMVLYYLGVVFLIIVLALMGKKIQRFPFFLQPYIGISFIMCAVAAAKVLVAGVLSTIAFVKVRRTTETPYAVF